MKLTIEISAEALQKLGELSKPIVFEFERRARLPTRRRPSFAERSVNWALRLLVNLTIATLIGSALLLAIPLFLLLALIF